MANNFVYEQGPENQGYGPAQVGSPTRTTALLTGAWPAHVPVPPINTFMGSGNVVEEIEDVNTSYLVPECEPITALTRVEFLGNDFWPPPIFL